MCLLVCLHVCLLVPMQGITNTVATIPGIVTPSLVSAVAHSKDHSELRKQWQLLFIAAAGVHLVCSRHAQKTEGVLWLSVTPGFLRTVLPLCTAPCRPMLSPPTPRPRLAPAASMSLPSHVHLYGGVCACVRMCVAR